MPPVRRKRPTRANRLGTSKSAPLGDVSPEEAAAIRAAVDSKEQGPTALQQAGSVDWAKVKNSLGDPFDDERIPLSRLALMRRDPILSFGMAFIKTPLAKAKWHIDARDNNGPNAQVAANVDWTIRRIYASYVFQWSNALDFGFSAIVKRWEKKIPTGTYIDVDPDTGEKTELPLWNEGGIEPIVFKPFIPLRPQNADPVWSNDGEFDGILYTPDGGGEGEAKKIDVAHALWATHAKEENFGSIFGYPRLAYAYRYWWSYWFRWAAADRAFEKKADPSTIVRHPSGSYEDEDGNIIPYRDIAQNIGQLLRNGATVTMPSDVYESDLDGKPSSVPMWDIDFTKDAVDFEPFDSSFEYIDIQKLRALWVPEQALIEGGGGTSSRNVAKEMGSSFEESQAVIANQLVETINRWIIPQFLATNFAEFLAEGGSATLVMESFGDKDADFRNSIVQYIGQQEEGSKKLSSMVDLQKLLEEGGIPLLSFREQQAELKRIENQAATESEPSFVEPVPGESVGIVPSETGFSYVQPREVIYLSDDSSSFVESLPSSVHYSDALVRRAARQLRDEWVDMYREEYEEFANWLEEVGLAVEMSDSSESVRRAVRRLVKRWDKNKERIGTAIDRTSAIYENVIKRASDIEKKRSKVANTPGNEAVDAWINNHAAEFASRVTFTTREDFTAFIAKRLQEGENDAKKLAQEIREHFADFPYWKADRLARTEIREAYNAGTLLTAQRNGLQVQAIDGTGDKECEERNGEIHDPVTAFTIRDHPNGTLGWRILPVELSYQIVESDEMEEGQLATFDAENHTVIFSDEVSTEQINSYMLKLGEQLIA